MSKSISRTEIKNPRSAGDKSDVDSPDVAPGPLADVDRWIEKQKEPPSRPEGIRRLVETG
jgi:hypothetical protein